MLLNIGNNRLVVLNNIDRLLNQYNDYEHIVDIKVNQYKYKYYVPYLFIVTISFININTSNSQTNKWICFEFISIYNVLNNICNGVII